MRQRILTVLGVAVALLALYTIAFRARPTNRWTSVAQGSIGAGRLPVAVATQAAGSAGGEVEIESTAAKAAGRTAESDSSATEEKRPETWGSDPFVRDWIMINELAEMNLNAITIGGDKAYALINDQILEVGDKISGKRIVLIEEEKVVFEQGGRTFDLLLGE